MTVKELIAILQDRDPDAKVYIPRPREDCTEVWDAWSVGPVEEWTALDKTKYPALVIDVARRK